MARVSARQWERRGWRQVKEKVEKKGGSCEVKGTGGEHGDVECVGWGSSGMSVCKCWSPNTLGESDMRSCFASQSHTHKLLQTITKVPSQKYYPKPPLAVMFHVKMSQSELK